MDIPKDVQLFCVTTQFSPILQPKKKTEKLWKIQLHFYSILAENGKAKLERLIENVSLESYGKVYAQTKVATKSVTKYTLRQKLPQKVWQSLRSDKSCDRICGKISMQRKIATKFPELENGKTN